MYPGSRASSERRVSFRSRQRPPTGGGPPPLMWGQLQHLAQTVVDERECDCTIRPPAVPVGDVAPSVPR